MYVSVGKLLGGHVIGMIACGQPAPVVEQFVIRAGLDGVFEGVEGFDGILLHRISQPRGKIA